MTDPFRKAYTTNQYASMPPERIVLALFDGILVNLERAIFALDDGDMETRGVALQKALAIVSELQASLDLERGGEIGVSLNMLYSYVSRELVRANLNDDRDAMLYCGRLIQEVREGWCEMVESGGASQTAGKLDSEGYV